MSHGKSIFLRIIMILVAAILIAGGLWGIGLALHLSPAEKLGEYADTGFWGTLTDKSWYPTVLGVASAILILLGLWFWWLIIDRRRVTKVEAKESADNGRVTVRLDDIASAVSQELTRYDGIADCKYRSEVDRGQKVLTMTLRCDPHADLDHVRGECRQAASDIVSALPQEDVDTRFLIHLDKAS